MTVGRGANDRAILQRGAPASEGIDDDGADCCRGLFSLWPPVVTPANHASGRIDRDRRRHGRDIHELLVNERIWLKPTSVARLVNANWSELSCVISGDLFEVDESLTCVVVIRQQPLGTLARGV